MTHGARSAERAGVSREGVSSTARSTAATLVMSSTLQKDGQNEWWEEVWDSR